MNISTVRQHAEPHLKKHNPDGPVLVCSDGSLHWLTLLERLQLWLKLITIDSLDKKYSTINGN